MTSDQQFQQLLRTILQGSDSRAQNTGIVPSQPVPEVGPYATVFNPNSPVNRRSPLEDLNSPCGRKDVNELFAQIMSNIGRSVQKPNIPTTQKPSNIPVVPQEKPLMLSGDGVEDTLFEAINNAEMQGQKDHWIRTKHKPEDNSSTAYGPLQLTTTLAKGYRNRKTELFDNEELAWLDKFINQGRKFINHDKGIVTDSRFAYGGSGELTTKKDKEMYTRVVKKMLRDVHDRHDGNAEKIWREWRFGGKGEGHDSSYRDKFFDVLDNATI